MIDQKKAMFTERSIELCLPAGDFTKNSLEHLSISIAEPPIVSNFATLDRTMQSKLVFHIMDALAELERALISQRSKAGMQAAKRRGKQIGQLHN